MREAIGTLFTMVAFLFLLSSCKDFGVPESRVEISGTYSYTAFNLSGTEVASGTLVIARIDSRLSGELTISGNIKTLEGRVDSSRIELSDSQIPSTILVGWKQDGTIEGDVFFESGGPPVARRIGTFHAGRIGN